MYQYDAKFSDTAFSSKGVKVCLTIGHAYVLTAALQQLPLLLVARHGSASLVV